MLLLYFDTEDQWPRAYKELSIFLSPFVSDISGNGRCQVRRDALYEDWVICTGTRAFRSARSRWWFLAIANCDPTEADEKRLYNNESIGVYSEFSIQMTNGLPSEVLKYQFSIDEWLILPSDTLFLALQAVLIVCVWLIGRSLSARRLYHNTYRMCSQSITMNTVGLAFLVTNYVIYAMDGIGLPIILTSGQFIRFWAPPIFTLIANFFLNNWVRAEVVNIVENCVTFYGYIVFLYLSRPTEKNSNFPFHIRTTQVDIDVGFDPQTAYAASNGSTPNDGMHGVIELTVTNSQENEKDDVDEMEDKGVIDRQQFTN
uniref:GpcrRhopsn4 domain-containing protein n=1 Tax=Caenorhabditis japonica TaxID=281687 RepID=A0A8R1HWH2_CAEJA